MTTYHVLSLLERFEIAQAMFPDRLNDEDHDIGDAELIIEQEFDMEPEAFDRLVGRLVMLAPAMQSPLTGKLVHALGVTDFKNGQFIAAVKREANQPS